ncbi:MAG: T9SS type A sorting domain-containing protein [Janthinobacterium lividum]
MDTSTFLQKISYNSRLWQLFLPFIILLLGVCAAPNLRAQPTLTATTIIIAPNSGANVSYDANNVSSNPDFNGANLGSFDLSNNGQLVLKGGTATTTESTPYAVSGVALYYRIRSSSSTGLFTGVALSQTGTTTNTDNSVTRTFALSSATQNLLANTAGPLVAGTYNVDVFIQATYSDGTTSSLSKNDDNGGNYYIANFTVSVATVNTTWTGLVDDNWFNPNNWDSGGVPTATSDATIPNFPSSSSRKYPNIYSGVVKPDTPAQTIKNPDGSTDNIPASAGYDNTTSGNAQVRTITLQAASTIDRSILRLVQGRLDVYGDFNNPTGSFIQRSTGVISFKSSGLQTISGSLNGFTNVEIDGGASSIKMLTNNFTIKAGGYLKFINGILQTNSANASTNFVGFEAATTDNTTSPATVVPAGQLLGESETSFLRGFITTTQVASAGKAQTFSNIGLTLNFSGNEPGSVTVTRTNDSNNTPSAFGGSMPKPGIRRVFGVQPGNPNTDTGGLTTTVSFAYLTNELSSLRTDNANDNTGSDDQNKLALYVSTNNGNTYSQLGRDSNTGNVLYKSAITSFSTLTLSEQQTPLPVELISFDAKRSDTNVLVTWLTATEISNSGFEVQVSTDGINFRKIAFVASQAINSTNQLQYTYLDQENGKYGVRYYRLRQIDQDGKDTFSPVRVVSFSATSNQVASLSVYPNPFDSGQVKLALESATAGQATLRVTDLMGREVSSQTFSAMKGVTEISINQAAQLASGSYLAQITAPSGEIKTVRIQKH